MKLGILLSGRGSNMVNLAKAVKSGHIPASVEAVFSDRSDAPGLGVASELGIKTHSIDPKKFSKREEYDREVVSWLQASGVELVCLCGYMRIITPFFVSAFKERILNIHPSLLPSFPGLNAQRQALDYGVKVAGATVHFVDEGVDTGPVLLQGSVRVSGDDDVKSLSEKILKIEHEIYPEAVKAIAEGRVRLMGRSGLIEGEKG